MANHRKDLEAIEQASNETIIAIVVGKHDRDRWEQDRRPESQRNTVLSREEGLKLLDEEFNDGFGGADCFPFYAWTESTVFFVTEYDGSTAISCVPRNPIDIEPQFDGATGDD